METLTNLESRMTEFVALAQKRFQSYWDRMKFTHQLCPVLVMDAGPKRRYAAVYVHEKGQRSRIYCFIDTIGGTTLGKWSIIGDIYKPATYKAPAKHARGNVFDDDCGVGALTDMGDAVRYL